MSAKDDFITYELFRLLELARKIGVLEEMDAIVLYGGAHYRSFSADGSIPTGSDYDCWILFREGAMQAAQRYSDNLFVPKERFLKYSLRQPTLLYEKIQSCHPGRILAPFITTMDAISSVIDAHCVTTHGAIYLPWYRLTPRQRSLHVPATAFDGTQILLDLQQRYIKRHNLWRLAAPAFAAQEERYYLSFIVESLLTSSVVYDAHLVAVQHLATLAQAVAQQVCRELPSITSPSQQAASIYDAFTISKKTSTAFRTACVQRLTRWISC